MHLKLCLNSHIQHINNINLIQAAIVESAENIPFKILTIKYRYPDLHLVIQGTQLSIKIVLL